ncbi:hypothetical protein INT45_007519 [Circinella minor]|uniref:RNA polymerase I-specific transcription initiation factor RRN3 n=1 Tax=Circinella minor TaxID=1195481 RepID=A0A8H7SFJ0_9FUNG|nr:hypothetical protein INT45_007519 [Circinella minor]
MDTYRDPEIDETSIENMSRAKLTNTKMIMKTFVTGALKEKEQGNPKRYDELVSLLLTDPNHVNAPSTLKLYLWIQILSENVSRLDKSCATLVEAVLDIDWAFRETKFAEVYVAFLEHLVTAHAFYVVPVLRKLIKGFKYRLFVPSYAKTSRSEVYKRNHIALQSILKLIPTSVMPLYEAVVAYIPMQRENSASQAAYIRNILELVDYVPFLRKQILMLLVNHMIQFDAHIQIELDELQEDVELQEFKLDFDADYESDDSDNDDLDQEDDVDNDNDDDFDSDAGDSDNETERRESEERRKQKIASMTRKLDAMMLLLFRYLSNFTMDGAGASERTDLFNTLITIFDSTVVKTLKSRYTQFLIFYFCSVDVNAYPELFLNHLLEHMMDPSRPGITRISCAMYIASYVARAKFLDISSIQRSINVLSAWCNDYIDHHEFQGTQPDASKYDMFYAAMQAIMYIFCFRWRELISEDGLDELVEEPTEMIQQQQKPNTLKDSNNNADGMNDDGSYMVDTVPLITIGGNGDVTRNWCVGLKTLPRLISSRLNPLKVCSNPVVQQFAHVARTTNFMYVHPIIQRNKRIVISGGMAHTNLQAVQSFFPFDPYELKTSRQFIENIYMVWRGENEEEDEDSSSDEDDSSEDDEDSSSSDEGEVMTGMSAMSISPAHPHLIL